MPIHTSVRGSSRSGQQGHTQWVGSGYIHLIESGEGGCWCPWWRITDVPKGHAKQNRTWCRDSPSRVAPLPDGRGCQLCLYTWVMTYSIQCDSRCLERAQPFLGPPWQRNSCSVVKVIYTLKACTGHSSLNLSSPVGGINCARWIGRLRFRQWQTLRKKSCIKPQGDPWAIWVSPQTWVAHRESASLKWWRGEKRP